MRILLFFTFIYLLSGCTTIEVAKEVNKASQSIKTSVKKIIKNDKKKLEVSNKNESDSKKIETIEKKIEVIEKERKIVEAEKKKEKKLVKEQKKLVEINFLGKTFNELILLLGKPQLIRLDANVKTVRFDTNKCRLFLYFNNKINIARVEHFEIRDIKGNLINIKKQINECYKDFKLNL
jgi:hypothetical protein